MAKEDPMLQTLNRAMHSRGRSAGWMWSAAAGIGALYVGSTLLTPLYPLYQREFGFEELTVTGIYAVYAIGNLAALLVFGRLSDQAGRRVSSLLALALTMASAVCFLVATATPWLFAGRVVGGFAVGIGAGAATAWIAELEPHRNERHAAVVASGANLAGLAAGALVSGVLAQAAPWPLRMGFVVYLALLGAMLALVWVGPETVRRPRRNPAAWSLRPRLGIPRGLRLAFVAPAAMAFAAFALGGFYAALVPGLLASALHVDSPAVTGVVVAAFFGSASATALASGEMHSRTAMVSALALLLVGLGLLLLAEAAASMALLIVATVVAGAAMACGYRGSLQIVNQIAPEDRRGEVVSTYLLVCYGANALPVLGVGLLAPALGPAAAHRIFALVLAIAAAIACAIGWRFAPRR